MAVGSGDYLYCSHRTCRRRFCSEGALDKHYGSFHGRPTCETCGKKLKKSGKVRLPPSLPLFARLTQQTSILARCWIQVHSSRITPHSTLFPTPTTLATTTIPRMLRCVQPARQTTRATNSSHQHGNSMLTSPRPRSLPRTSRGLALSPLPSTLMVSTAPNSSLPHRDPSTMTTTARAAAPRRSRMT